MRNFVFYLLLLALASSCKKISTQAPQETFQKVSFSPEVSELNIPIEISLNSIQALANKNLNGLLYEDNDLDEDKLAIKIWKNDTISVKAQGNILSYTVPLKIWVKTALKLGSLGIDLGQTKETEFALALKY